jgi:hypothetical protein
VAIFPAKILMSSDRNLTRNGSDWPALIGALVFPSLVTLVYFVWLAEWPTTWQQFAYGIGKILQFGFPVVWVRLVQRQPLSVSRCLTRNLVEGGLLGAAILLGMACLHFAWLRTGSLPASVLEAIRAKISGLGVASPARFFVDAGIFAVGYDLVLR